MIYVVDIDDTICTSFTGEDGSRQYDKAEPLPERIEKINELYDQGETIIYWTARGSSTGLDWAELTKDQLDSWGCKYHELWMGKPSYDIWIDDKAINSDMYFSGALQ